MPSVESFIGCLSDTSDSRAFPSGSGSSSRSESCLDDTSDAIFRVFREARGVSGASRLCSVLEAVSALVKVVVTLGEAMNLKLKTRVLVKLFLALALMSVCHPDWH